MPDAPVAKPLEGVFPPRLVARLHRERFEGTLRLHGGGATRVLYFRRGEIASAASNAEEDRLPSILIREGRLTGPQVEMARSKQRPGISLGKTLIELGFLTPAELLAGARRQVRQILAAAFALRDGTSQEAPGPLPPEVTVLGLPVRRLIFDALLEAGDRQAVVREMGSMETVYRPSTDLSQALPAMRLEPRHEEVARLVDGEATLREISGRVQLDDLTVSKIVLALEILGLVDRASPVEESEPQGRRIPIIVEDDEPLPAPGEPPRRLEAVESPRPEAPPWEPPPQREAMPTREETAPRPVAIPPREETTTDRQATASPAVEEWPSPQVPTAPAYDPPAASPFAAAGSDRPPRGSGWDGEEEAEPPPIPPGELPAFAAPPNAPIGWTVDPETGEKVHLGPIELTFDGPVVPPRDRTTARGRLALVGSALALVAAAVIAFFALRGGGSTDRPDQVASAAGKATQEGAETAPPPAEPPAAESTGSTAAESAPAAAAPSTGPAANTPAERPATPPEQPTATPASEARTGAPAQTPGAVEAPPQAAAATPPAVAGAGFGFGQRLLDAGTIDRAVDVFSRALQPIPRDRFTLQMMIACEAETVRKARAGTRPDEGLFVLPIRVRDRGCYRVLWGVFDSRAAASGAKLPSYFASSGVTPAVVAIDRLRPPA